jgi:hypothetical protein
MALKLRVAAAAIKRDPFPITRPPHPASFKRRLGSALKDLNGARLAQLIVQR